MIVPALVFIGILLLAVFLRLPGDLSPAYARYDEQHALWAGMKTMVGLNTDFSPWPGTPYFGLLALADIFLFFAQTTHSSIHALVSGAFQQLWEQLEQYCRAFAQDPGPQILLARELTFALNMGAILFLGWALWKRVGPAAGLAAALYLAVLPLHVEYATYIRPDSLSTLLALITLFLAASAMDTTRKRSWVWTGIGLGLAIATKMEAAVLILPIAIVFFWERASLKTKTPSITQVGLGLLLPALASFLIAYPYLLSNTLESLRWIHYQWGAVQAGKHLSFQMVAHCWKIFSWQLGWPLMFWAGYAVWETLRSGTPLGRLASLTTLINCLIYVLSFHLGHPRYLLMGLASLSIVLGENLHRRLIPRGKVFLFLGLVLLLPLHHSFMQQRALLKRETQLQEAHRWISQFSPPGTRIALDAAVSNILLIPGNSYFEFSGKKQRIRTSTDGFSFSLERVRQVLEETPVGDGRYQVFYLPYSWDEKQFSSHLEQLLRTSDPPADFLLTAKPIPRLGTPIKTFEEVPLYLYEL